MTGDVVVLNDFIQLNKDNNDCCLLPDTSDRNNNWRDSPTPCLLRESRMESNNSNISATNPTSRYSQKGQRSVITSVGPRD